MLYDPRGFAPRNLSDGIGLRLTREREYHTYGLWRGFVKFFIFDILYTGVYLTNERYFEYLTFSRKIFHELTNESKKDLVQTERCIYVDFSCPISLSLILNKITSNRNVWIITTNRRFILTCRL